MLKNSLDGLKTAFRTSIPILFGYLPLGFTFGLLFSSLHINWIFGILSSTIILAGSAQFISIELFKSGASLPEFFLTIFFINIRHVFYGISLLSRFKTGLIKKAFLIHSLTDETYSILTAKTPEKKNDLSYCLFLCILNNSYWIIGTMLGLLLGKYFNFNVVEFEFVLTALFIVLLIEQVKKVRKLFPFMVALLSCLIALLFSSIYFIILSQLISLIILLIYFNYKSRES